MMDSVAQYNGFKNRLINGAMQIDQRNAGASVTLGSTSGQYLLDRWNFQSSQASKISVQQNAGSITPPVGFSKYLGVTSLSAYSVLVGDYFDFGQAIEGFNVADLGWGTANAQTVTLSFWVRSSLTGTFGGSLRNSAQNRSYPFTYTISAANTWEQKSVTIAGDTSGTWATDNTAGLQIYFGLGFGATYSGTAGAWTAGNYISATGATSVVGTNGATFYITGVQLEKGVTATSFDYRPYTTELQLCQRYYYKEPDSAYHASILDGNTGNFPAAWATHPVEMRATPTAAFEAFGNFYYNSGSASTFFVPAGGSTSYGGNARLGYAIRASISNSPGATQNQKVGQWVAQLSFSAEL
jgi:hypothetical protein